MWKSLTSLVNRLVTDAPTPPADAAVPAISCDWLDRQFQQAVILARNGNPAGATELLDQTCRRVMRAVGDADPLYAEAQFRHATLFAGIGDVERAAATCQIAVDVPARDPASRERRLEYVATLAELSVKLDRFEEAESTLRAALDERKSLHGESQPGVAAGLAALADFLWRRGRHAEALPVIDDAIRIDAAANDERLPRDLSLRAFIVRAPRVDHEEQAAAIDRAESLSGAQWKAFLQDAFERADHSPPGVALAVLTEAREKMSATADAVSRFTVNVAIANLAKALGNHELRIDAAQQATALADELNDPATSIRAQQSLAAALADAGRPDDADAAFASAVASAQALDQPALTADVMRDAAEWAERSGRPTEAESLYRDAASHGARSGDWATHGRALAAHGGFLRRRGRLAEATSVLRNALDHLPAGHPDAAAAREQLAELERDSAGASPGA